jgi:hypothetical protein
MPVASHALQNINVEKLYSFKELMTSGMENG